MPIPPNAEMPVEKPFFSRIAPPNPNPSNIAETVLSETTDPPPPCPPCRSMLPLEAVAVMANEHAEDGLKDDEKKAQQSDGPKNLGSKRPIIPQREDGAENTHDIKLTELSSVAQKQSRGGGAKR